MAVAFLEQVKLASPPHQPDPTTSPKAMASFITHRKDVPFAAKKLNLEKKFLMEELWRQVDALFGGGGDKSRPRTAPTLPFARVIDYDVSSKDEEAMK